MRTNRHGLVLMIKQYQSLLNIGSYEEAVIDFFICTDLKCKNRQVPPGIWSYIVEEAKIKNGNIVITYFHKGTLVFDQSADHPRDYRSGYTRKDLDLYLKYLNITDEKVKNQLILLVL